jgi:hypothetical protein
MSPCRATCLFATAIAACGAAVPPVPGKGGPTWHELTTDHFVVWTDVGEARAKELVGEIERLRQVVVGTAFPRATSMSKSFVIALRDDAETSAFIPGDFAALTSPPNGNLLSQPVIVMSAQSNVIGNDRVTAHELVHAISHAVIPVQPRWFAEGMAKFYETVDIGPDYADIGRAPDYRGQPIAIHHFEPIREMLACKTLACTDYAFYATAWAFYTYLANTQSDRLASYEAVLVQTRDPEQAWKQAFADTSPEQLEQDMRQWLVNGKHQVLHFKVSFQGASIAERALGDADVYAARAFMRFEFLGDAKQDVAAAVRVLKTAGCAPACRP